jgi:hypothetical protein
MVSGGLGECGDSRFPGIYVRLDHPEVLDFILDAIGQGSQPSEGNCFQMKCDCLWPL